MTPSCGDNPTTAPSASTTTTVAVSSNLAFTGTADGVKVSMEFFDDYLGKVLSGNPYNNGTNTPPATLPYTLSFQILINGFNYYSDHQIDISCDKSNYNNKVLSFLKGSLPNGHQALFSMSTDGSFYACDTTLNPTCPVSAWVVQGTQDEIGTIQIYPYNPVYECTGTDGNDYWVTVYGSYNRNGVSINDSFNVKTTTFKGVISVQIKDYNDPIIYLFVK